MISCCNLSALYHMAKQHSKGVSTQATDKTTVQSSVQYLCTARHELGEGLKKKKIKIFLSRVTTFVVVG